MFVSCVVLEIVGAAAATITNVGKFADNPTAGFTSHLPTGLADVTLLAIALGAVCANALNVYSGSMSFLALGIKLPLHLRRAIVALVFGVAGFFLALSGLHDAGEKYNNFLLVISYWIGPWLGVFFADQFLRRGKRVDGFLFDRKHNPWAGFAAMAIAMAVSIYLLRQPDRVHRRRARSTSRASATSPSRSASCSPPCSTRCSSGCRAREKTATRHSTSRMRRPSPAPDAQAVTAGGAPATERPRSLTFRRNVTCSSAPSQITVCCAGVARATTLPPRSTSVRGATSRSASASDGASNTTRSAGPPGRSP